MAEYSLGTAKGRVIIDYDDKGLRIAADDFEKVEGKAKKAGTGFAEAGTKLALAGGVIAAGLGLAAKTAIDFEKQISAIGAVSGATKDQLEILRKKALQIGADTSFSATQAALAMEELAKAGVSVTDIMNGAADATVALAAAGGIDLPEAATLAADAMNAFSLAAKDLPKVADLIAGAANASSISVGEFGQSLKQVGAVANLVGLSFADTAAAIALMGQAGIKGSDAGTSLKTMLSNLIPVTIKQKELFRELGLITKDGSNAFFDARGNIKSFAEIAGILQTATKGMTNEQKQLTLETLFGSDAIRAAAIVTKAGAQGFNNMAEAMGKVSAADVASARLDNTAGAIERLKGSAETAAIAFGTLLLPALTKTAGHLEKLANFFTGLSKSTQNVIVNVALVTSSFLLFLGLAVKIFQFAKAVQIMVVAIKAWSIWARVAQVATAAWAAVQWVLAAAMNATFLIVILVIAIIAALVIGIILLWKHNETFRKIVMAVWEAVKKAIAAVVDWFVNKAVPWLKGAWDKILTFFKAAWKVIQVIMAAIARVISIHVKVIMAVINFLAPLFKSVFGLIVSIIKTAIAIVSAIFSVFRAVTKAIFEPLLNGLVALFKFVFNKISENVQAAFGIIKAVWNAIVAFLTPIFEFIGRMAVIAFNVIKNAVMSVFNFLKPFVIAAIGIISNVITTAWNVIQTATKIVWNALKDFFTTLWDGIVAIFTFARDRIIELIDGIKVIVDKVKKFFGDLKAAADQGIGPLFEFVKGIPGKILGAIGDLGALLFDKGKALVQGLIDGIKSLAGKLADTAKALIGNITKFLPGSPAEEGPLSGKGYVLKRGQRFVADFATGILGAAKTARDAMSSMISGAVGKLPVNGASAVGAAQSTLAPISVSIPTSDQLSAAANQTSNVTIQNLNITGVWDLNNPGAPREIVAKLHEQLDRYERDHR